MERRDFLRSNAAMALAFGLAPAGRFFGSESLAPSRRLILVELTGGNDSLSMIVPKKSPLLHKLRPTLALPDQQLLPLSQSLGFHPNMPSCSSLLKKKQLAVINHVGYQHPNRSHFLSMDFWHSGGTDEKKLNVGWLGKALSDQAQKRGSSSLSLFHLADGPMPLCFAGSPHPVLSMRDPRDLKFSGEKDSRTLLRALVGQKRKKDSDIDFLLRSTEEALSSSEKLEGKKVRTDKAFSQDAFGKQMALVSLLAKASPGDQVLFTRITGFDTHSAQRSSQPALLASLDRGLGQIMKALDHKKFGSTTILVYSEFGRRVQENASKGTDHGAGGSVLVLGSWLKGGVFGGNMDLDNLLDGDLRPKVDFRTVYHEVLEGSLGIRAKHLEATFGSKLGLARTR